MTKAGRRKIKEKFMPFGVGEGLTQACADTVDGVCIALRKDKLSDERVQ